MAYGQGSVHRDSRSGKFVARYNGPDRKRHAKSFRLKTDAIRFLAEQQHAKVTGEWLDPSHSKITFGEWAEGWFKNRHRLGEAARTRDRSLLNHHVLPTFGHRPIGAIGPLEVREWINNLVAVPLMPRTIHACHRLFSGAMRAAVAAKVINDAPVGRGVVDLPKIERKTERFLSELDMERLLAEFSPLYKPLIYAAAYTGCRWQELAGLKHPYLDLDKGKLLVHGVVKRNSKGKYVYVEQPKTDAGRRTIALPKRLVQILQEHLDSSPESQWVFSGKYGSMLDATNFRDRVWLPAVKRAGLEPLTFHDLRHTHAAWLIREGVQPLPLQRRLGHEDIRTTMNVYGHLFPNFEDDLVVTLDQRWSEAIKAIESAKVISLNLGSVNPRHVRP